MAFDATLFGQAAAELMTLRLGEVTKAHDDIAARLAVLEKALRDVEKENAALRERVQAQAETMQAQRAEIESAVKTVAGFTPPEKGDKGDAGERGEKGVDGRDGVDGIGIADAIIDAEGALVLTFTDGRTKTLGVVRGEKGVAGADGRDGGKGDTGAQGSAGRDGVGIADACIDDAGALVLTLTDGTVKMLGRVVGADGRDGARGDAGGRGEKGDGVKDAIIDNVGNLILTFTDGSTKCLGRVVGESFSDFALEYLPDTHEIAMRATCAGVTKSLRYPAGGIRALGYWRDGKSAKAGEAVSLGGCLYIAKVDTKAKPSYDHPDWFLAVQRGRDMTADTKNIQRNADKPVQLISAEGEK